MNILIYKWKVFNQADVKSAFEYFGHSVDMYEENNKAEEYEKSIMFEKKPSLWQKFKKSKFARAISYVFKIRITIF